MIRAFCGAVLFALAGCAAQPPAPRAPSPCDQGEASYACQVERYFNVNAD